MKAEKKHTLEEDMVRIVAEVDRNKRKESETKISCSWMTMDWATLQKNIGIMLIEKSREHPNSLSHVLGSASRGWIPRAPNHALSIMLIFRYDRDICMFNSRFMNLQFETLFESVHL